MSEIFKKLLIEELSKKGFFNDRIENIVILAGLSSEDRQRNMFDNKEYTYLSTLYYNLSPELVEQYGRYFLGGSDKNVERIINSAEPIIYNRSLVSNESKKAQGRIDEMLSSELSDYSVMIPVAPRVESRWKGIVWFDVKKTGLGSPNDQVAAHKDYLMEQANFLYELWRYSVGKFYNLYLEREIFAEQAIRVANYLAEGYSSKQIAEFTCLSKSGVEYHIETMKKNLSVKNRNQLIAELIRKGIVK
ncbi:helix-turn-helix transcriptional regulator [Vibrio sp. SCSIO 43137]|uniref:helix-turn-helix transcriptional regulator n=1 Tax=Vibrio sp. SCSIO 43137 TaxID=3021011 RepID=UPI002307B13E|nr:LuxR C-terminal-related transcriptional regulator [Vibrio sp. SCSIO 43137]WCE30561.1 LuxR C-terminal-related transcriptional regulator [Vibrio sp. SCSIO 43137]